MTMENFFKEKMLKQKEVALERKKRYSNIFWPELYSIFDEFYRF